MDEDELNAYETFWQLHDTLELAAPGIMTNPAVQSITKAVSVEMASLAAMLPPID